MKKIPELTTEVLEFLDWCGYAKAISLLKETENLLNNSRYTEARAILLEKITKHLKKIKRREK